MAEIYQHDLEGGVNRAAILPVTLAVAYPLLSHASVALKAPFLQWLALSCFAAVPLVNGLAALRLRPWLLFTGIAALLWLLTHWGGGQFALYLPPLVLTGVLSATFAASLLPGRTPLITHFASMARGGVVPPDLIVYCRKLTVFWACMTGGSFLATLWLTVFGPLWLWSWYTNFFSHVLMGTVFVAEFFLRRKWFAHHPHGAFWTYLKFMTRMRGVKPPP